MIRLENISLDIYGAKRRILSDINWHIKKGESWVLFGRNGSGKTRLLEIITGYIFPTEGQVYRFGRGYLDHDIREARRRIGYVSSALRERFTLNETLIDSVLGGLYASVGLYRRPSRTEAERAAGLIAGLELGGRERDMIGTLSDGEKQKIMMLRALINEPEILIFDEPAAGLDILAREEMLDSISSIASSGNITTVYVTHHVEEITPLFTKIFVLDNGLCRYSGPVGPAVKNRSLDEVFGGRIKVFQKNGRLHSSAV